MNDKLIKETAKAVRYNPSRLAHVLGMNYSQAREAIAKLVDITPIKRPTEPMPSDITTLGKGKIAKYVIAVKANGDQWGLGFQADIHAARRRFDQGTHIMCQGKHPDGWVVLYSIPRKRPLENPQPFFSRNWGF